MSLRFRVRHVHKTIADYLEAELTRLGWVDEPVNFATVPMTFLEFQPDEAGKTIAANTVAITLGDEPAALDIEMGDGLREIAFPVFVDVYGANQSIAASIASDIKCLLEDKYMPVLDFVASATGTPPPSASSWTRTTSASRSLTPPAGAQDFRRFWRVVKTTARVHYIED